MRRVDVAHSECVACRGRYNRPPTDQTGDQAGRLPGTGSDRECAGLQYVFSEWQGCDFLRGRLPASPITSNEVGTNPAAL